jgi:aldehyde dehydrogenase (NAD+)
METTAIIEHKEVRDLLSKTPLEFFVGGKWVASSDARTFRTFDPGTGEVLAEVYEANAKDVATAVGAASDAFRQQSWSRLTPGDSLRPPAIHG